jgi:hypothetical protein
MKVVKRGGLTGTKVELYPTDKGFKRYYTWEALTNFQVAYV